MSTTVELHRKDAELQAVRAELVALRAGVSALADLFASRKGMLERRKPIPNARRISINALDGREACTWDVAALDLRNLLGAES